MLYVFLSFYVCFICALTGIQQSTNYRCWCSFNEFMLTMLCIVLTHKHRTVSDWLIHFCSSWSHLSSPRSPRRRTHATLMRSSQHRPSPSLRRRNVRTFFYVHDTRLTDLTSCHAGVALLNTKVEVFYFYSKSANFRHEYQFDFHD